METIVLIIHQVVFATRAVSKGGEYHSDIPSFSWGILKYYKMKEREKLLKLKFLFDKNATKPIFLSKCQFVPRIALKGSDSR